ncbi:MAG: Fic/DOC family N-terminal domain-containing protein [Myxococcales bacterium]
MEKLGFIEYLLPSSRTIAQAGCAQGDPCFRWARALYLASDLGKTSFLVPSRASGRLERRRVGGEEVAAFVPLGLPPREPPLTLDDRGRELLARAERSLSRLELAGEMVPSLEWFIYAFVRKEAVGSSQIEGTQATLIDLLTHEAEPAKGTTSPGIPSWPFPRQ